MMSLGMGRTSLRGGGGLFYDTRMNGLFNNGWISANPYEETFSSSSTTATDPTATFSTPYGKAANPIPRAISSSIEYAISSSSGSSYL